MTDQWFERVAGSVRDDAAEAERAPARLKSKVYSAVVSRLAEAGPLLDLAETKAAGRALCVFEHAVAILPVGSAVKSMNPCRVCHARVAGERLDRAPIFWPGCPYSEFHNG
jgi:hypothetical protein